MKITSPKNINIQQHINGITKKTQQTKSQLQIATINQLKKFQNHDFIYTDGSVKNKKSGIGIYTEYNKTKYAIKLINNTTITTTETIAIKIAILLAQLSKKDKIVIITDSQTSCKSLENALNHSTSKHYENQIIDIAGHNNQKDITIQWIPGHIDIKGNVIADKLAKMAQRCASHKLENEPTIIDVNNIIVRKIRQEWKVRYEEMTQSMAKKYKEICPKPRKVPWFKHITINSKDIGQITRLRTGHTYNKTYKHLIGLEQTPNCSNCNVPETNEHIISECQIYENIRRKYILLRQKTLKEILQGEVEVEYKTLIKYINEIDYKL